MILVTLGTQAEPFTRLLDAIEKSNIKDEIIGLYDWYKDYMSCNIKNENIGLNKQIYMYKPVHESNFINSTKLNYFDEPTGTVEKIKSIINLEWLQVIVGIGSKKERITVIFMISKSEILECLGI